MVEFDDPDDLNPLARTPTRRTITALGLGIGIASVGITLGDLYRKPAVAIGGMALGLGVALAHLPWKAWVAEEKDRR